MESKIRNSNRFCDRILQKQDPRRVRRKFRVLGEVLLLMLFLELFSLIDQHLLDQELQMDLLEGFFVLHSFVRIYLQHHLLNSRMSFELNHLFRMRRIPHIQQSDQQLMLHEEFLSLFRTCNQLLHLFHS